MPLTLDEPDFETVVNGILSWIFPIHQTPWRVRARLGRALWENQIFSGWYGGFRHTGECGFTFPFHPLSFKIAE